MSDGALERVRDIVIIFLAGVAIVVGITVATYVSAVIFDKCCCGHQRLREALAAERERQGREEREMTNLRPRSRLESQIVYKAGLSTLSASDRKRILVHFFQARSKLHKDVHVDVDTGTEDAAQTAKAIVSNPDANKDDTNDNLDVPAGTEDSALAETPKPDRSDEAQNEPVQEERNSGDEESAEDHHDNDNDEEDEEENRDVSCSICLNGYADDDRVMTGTNCDHLFHYSCAMQWIGKNHDHCAYCRKDMLSSEEFRAAALQVLGQERLDQLEAEHARAVAEAETRAAQAASSNAAAAAAEVSAAAAATDTVVNEATDETNPNQDQELGEDTGEALSSVDPEAGGTGVEVNTAAEDGSSTPEDETNDAPVSENDAGSSISAGSENLPTQEEMEDETEGHVSTEDEPASTLAPDDNNEVEDIEAQDGVIGDRPSESSSSPPDK